MRNESAVVNKKEIAKINKIFIKILTFLEICCIIINVEWTRFDKPKNYFERVFIMAKYVENNLQKNEQIVQKAKISKLSLVGVWAKGILLFWLLLIPTIKAIYQTFLVFCLDSAVTNKRFILKKGIISTSVEEIPINKIQNAVVVKTFWGSIFGFGTIKVSAAGGDDIFVVWVKNPNGYKNAIMTQVEQYEEDRVKQQAAEMAQAMAAAMKQN